MLDSNTLYLLLAMVLFVFIAIGMVHQHSNNEQIQKKRAQVQAFTNKLNLKIAALEQEIVNLKIQADELEDEINSFQTKADS